MKDDPKNPYPIDAMRTLEGYESEQDANSKTQERVEFLLRNVMNFHTEVCDLMSQIVATRAHLNDLLVRVEDATYGIDGALLGLLAEMNETRRIVNQMFEPEPVAENKAYS